MREGVFWVVPRGVLHGVQMISEFNGELGHAAIWEITIIYKYKELSSYAYDDFPRGRVWIKDGMATIFLDKKINTPSIIQQIDQIFCLNGNYQVETDD